MDEGSPTSTGGLRYAITLSEALGIPLTVRVADKFYKRGWGFECKGPSTVICSWSITELDAKGRRTTMDFDLFDDDSPILIGLYIKEYSNTEEMHEEMTCKFRRPLEKQ